MSVLGGSTGGAALDDLILVANKADLAAPAVGTVAGEGAGAKVDLEDELTSLAAAAAVAGALLPDGSAVTEAGKEEAGDAVVAATARGAAVAGGEEGGETEGGRQVGRRRRPRPVWKISCKTKEGLDGFMEHLEAEVRSRFQGAADDESPLITRYVCVCVCCLCRSLVCIGTT